MILPTTGSSKSVSLPFPSLSGFVNSLLAKHHGNENWGKGILSPDNLHEC